MSYITTTMDNLIHQTAFFNMTWGNVVMILVACVFLYLAIAKEFEPLLLVPIAFGMLLVNIYPDIMLSFEDSSNGVGGLLYYFYKLDEWAILPSLIFMGVGAMTDFGPLIANPKSFLLGAAAQFGIFAAYFGAIAMGFNDKAAAAISIIGGADGPTSIFLCGKLGQTQLLGPIAVAAYSYMSLVPIIQPPIMKLLTTEKERKIKMEQLRPVTKLERILFPIIVTIVVCLILPTYPAINDDRLYKALIPLPPLSEQHRIVAKIEELLPYIERYGKAEEHITALNTTFPEALKKSILQEAVQGKLVPQDPDDEPASVLLERIRVEKQKLIKAGKIKKSKHESVIVTRDKIPYEIIDGKKRCIADEVPFEIPDSWCWCRCSTRVAARGKEQMGVEEIQDQVERELMKSSRKDVAREYISYRNKRLSAASTNGIFWARCLCALCPLQILGW